MEMAQFLREMEEILDVPNLSINEQTQLADCESWDSLAMLTFAVMASEKFGRELSGRSLRDVATVAELYSVCADGVVHA
jgi:acyl carrier protein